MKKFRYLIYILIIGLAACTSTEECGEDTEVTAQINFYQKTPSLIDGSDSLITLTVDSISVRGLSVDSVLYNNSKSKTYIYLPLNKLAEQSDYIMTFNSTTDTISILYHNDSSYYLSIECGCIVLPTIDEIVSTNHYIDSVSIITNTVIPTNAENIQIYHF
ncbi:MAG: DUF6452 family protein [Paludibacter sp.]|nr:DUF6452 family protein [Paludibacter sp.]